MSMVPFQEKYTLAQRLAESKKVINRYPDRIPVILESNSKEIVLDKHKYLVPRDLTMGQFIYVIRKRIKLRPEEGLFLFVDNTMVNTSAMISSVYLNNHNEDLFVYFVVSKENTFG